MSGGEEDWHMPHWRRDRDAGRGGGYGGGRSGSRDSYTRTQSQYGEHQYGDRQQQSQNQRERGSYNRGPHPGRHYANFVQQHEGFSSHAGQQHQGFGNQELVEHHPNAGFRAPAPAAHFSSAELRPPAFGHYGQEAMMSAPQRLPGMGPGAAPAVPYHPHVVPAPRMHSQFGRPAAMIDQPAYPIAQPYLQHPVVAGHQGPAMNMGMTGTGGVGVGVGMHPQAYHPGAPRTHQHAGAWGSGAPNYRNPDAGRGTGGGPGRGGGGMGGGGARRASRAPQVPQPVVPNASAQGESTNPGMNSLGRPRQQPSSTINNVQSSRGAPPTGQASVHAGGTADTSNQRQDDSVAAVKLAFAGDAAPAAGSAQAEANAPDTAAGATQAPQMAEVEPQGPASEGSRDTGATSVDASAAACNSAVDNSNSGSSISDDASTNAGLQSSAVAAASVAEAHAISTAQVAAKESHAQGSALPAAPLSVSPVAPASPQPPAPATGPGLAQPPQSAGEKPPAPAGGSAWKERTATALFAPGAASAGGAVAQRKSKVLAPHAATTPQGPAAAATPGAMTAAVGAPPSAAAVVSGPAAAAGPHHHAGAPEPELATVAPPPRIQKRPAPVQTGPGQHPRAPPPGFGAAPLPLVFRAGAEAPSSEQHLPEAGHVQQREQQQQQQAQQLPQLRPSVSPRASGGSDAAESASLPVGHINSQQHSPTLESTSPAEPSEALKVIRKWAAVAAIAASAGPPHAKVPHRRPTSEGGSADPSAAAAAATLVGLRHAAHQPPGAVSSTSPALPPAAEALTGDLNGKAATAETPPVTAPVAAAESSSVAAAAEEPPPPRAVEPADAAASPAVFRTWAAAAAMSATSPAFGPARAGARGAAAGRGPGTKARHTATFQPGRSAQPPEAMFLPLAAAPPVAGVGSGVSGHSPAGFSPAPSPRPSGSASSPVQSMSPLSPEGTDTPPAAKTMAAAAGAATTPVPAEPGAACSVATPAADGAAAGTAVPDSSQSTDASRQSPPPVSSLAPAAATGTAAVPARHAVPAAATAVASSSPVVAPAAAAHASPTAVPGAALAASHDGGADPVSSKDAAAVQPCESKDSTWIQVLFRHKSSWCSRVADVTAHTHAVPQAGSAAGTAPRRGRGPGRFGGAASAAAAPHQRGAGAPEHQHSQQGGRGRGAAAQQPQHGSQPSAAAVSPQPCTVAASAALTAGAGLIPTVAPAVTPSDVGTATQTEAKAAESQAADGAAATPVAVPAPVVPSVSEAAPASDAPVFPTALVPTEAVAAASHGAQAVGAAAAAPAAPAAAAPAEAPPVQEASTALADAATAPSAEATAAPPIGGAEGAAEGPPLLGPASVAVPKPDLPKVPSQQQVHAKGPASAKTKEKKGSQVSAPADTQGENGQAEREHEEEEKGGPGAIPAGKNPWDLLGTASEDGEVSASASGAVAEASAVVAAATAAALAASVPTSGLMKELLQLLMPADTRDLQQLQGCGLRIQPRGLTNTGNTCFINATMQALLACAPFASMLSRLPAVAPLLEPSKTPTLHGLALFLAELVAPPSGAANAGGPGAASGTASAREDVLPGADDDGWAEVQGGRGKKGAQRRAAAAKAAAAAEVAPAAPATSPAASSAMSSTGSVAVVLGGQPLVPSMLSGIAAAFNPRISIAEKQTTMAQRLQPHKGVVEQEQQDAQEFFQFLVNRVHEEVVVLRKAHGLAAAAEAAASAGSGGGGDDGGDGEEWAQVGRKNKATVTRQVGTPADDASLRSPVSAIFTGQLKSTVRFQQPHAHFKPSATIEAFNMLHLDIAAEGVASLEDALRQHSVPESIEYKPDGASEMLPAKKDVRLYRLPEVLVLHLKRFTYTAAGGGRYTKLQKPVAFACSLRLEGKILADDCPDRANSEYRLFATINHHGRTIAGGHYIADVLQPDGRWIRFNDAEVTLIPESMVLGERPYLLFYQRLPQRAA